MLEDMKIIFRKEAVKNGLDRYYTGKPCRHGHLSERWTISRCCIECKVEKDKTYQPERRVKKRDQIAATHKLWRDRNPERVRGYVRAYEASPEYREKRKEYYARNRERIRARKAQYYLDHLDEHAERREQWYLSNPEKVKAANHRRRAKVANSIGSHSPQDIEEIYFLQNGKCAYCEKSLKKGFQIDHIIAITKGGTNFRNNIQLLCKDGCNQKKGTKDPIDYARSLGKLL